jgi:hypothetical protein
MTFARNARRYEKFRRKTIKASLQHIVSWEKLNLIDTETQKTHIQNSKFLRKDLLYGFVYKLLAECSFVFVDKI